MYAVARGEAGGLTRSHEGTKGREAGDESALTRRHEATKDGSRARTKTRRGRRRAHTKARSHEAAKRHSTVPSSPPRRFAAGCEAQPMATAAPRRSGQVPVGWRRAWSAVAPGRASRDAWACACHMSRLYPVPLRATLPKWGSSSAPARGAYASREARFRLPAQQLSGIRYVLAPGLVSRPPNRGGGRGQDVHQAMSWRQRAGQPFGPPCPRARASQTAARLTRFCTIPCLPFTPKPTLPPPSAPVAPSGACRDCSPPRASDRHLGRWPPHAECGPGSRLPCASCRPLEPQSDL